MVNLKYIIFNIKLPKLKSSDIHLYDDETLFLTDLFKKHKPFKIEFECLNFDFYNLKKITDEQYDFFLKQEVKGAHDYESFAKKYNFYEWLI